MSKETILNEGSLTFLEKYLNNPAPTGYEWEGQKIWMEYLKPYVDTFITDTYGTAVGVINPEADYKVVIEGHADEISWYVNYISDNGLIYVIRNGGSDHQIAPSKVVNIHTKNGIVKGVFGWPAIHTRDKGNEQAPKPDNITIDIGAATKDEVLEMGVHVGCVITYPDEFHILNGNKFVCRALDNRMGGFMIAEVARLLKENGKFNKYIHFDYVYSSTCPCSTELSLHALEQRNQYATPHSQRSVARISLKITDFVWIEDIQEMCLEALKTETQVFVKREDEQAFAELNAGNTKFVEDAVRLLFEQFDADKRVSDLEEELVAVE
mgnify:CR=1 FL=1